MHETMTDCLRGAGCTRELCEGAEKLSQDGRAEELLPQLAQRRMQLLAELHETDEQLACLDRAIGRIRTS